MLKYLHVYKQEHSMCYQINTIKVKMLITQIVLWEFYRD